MELAIINKFLLVALILAIIYIIIRIGIVWLPHWATMQYLEYKTLKEKELQKKLKRL